MLKLIKLIIYRIIHNKAFLITYLLLIPLVIAMAVYFTNNISMSMKIGVVGNVEVIKNDEIDFITLKELPKNSSLILSQYDAILIEEDHSYKVISLKGEEYNQAIKLLLSGQIDTLADDGQQRGTASNILGFLMMVISLLGVQIYEYYFDERKGINKRILSASVDYWQYMLSHFIVVFIFLFVPAVAVISGAIFIFDITLSIPLYQFILVLMLLCFFATSFGLWINSICKSKEESMMYGNMFAIVGTIISGGIIQVTDNEIFNRIVQIFPQKHVMTVLSDLENNLSLSIGIVGYVVVLSIALIVFAIIIEKKKLPSR